MVQPDQIGGRDYSGTLGRISRDESLPRCRSLAFHTVEGVFGVVHCAPAGIGGRFRSRDISTISKDLFNQCK